MSEVKDLISMAREEVVDAEKMLDAGISERKAWSSVYYSMFYAAKAALLSLGFDTKTHRGVNTLVGKELYLERSLIGKEEASFFSEMRRLREDLDYNPYAVLPDREVERALATAEEFIASMEGIVESHG